MLGKVFFLSAFPNRCFATPRISGISDTPVFPMPPFTQHDLESLGYTLQPDGSYSRAAHPPAPSRLPDPKPQPALRQTLDCQPPRKTERPQRVVVRITRHACRLLDADNFAGGCKPLIDQLRYAALIPDDDPESVELQFLQEKVGKKNLEAVTVEITHP